MNLVDSTWVPWILNILKEKDPLMRVSMSTTQTRNGSTWKCQHITLAAHVEHTLLFIVFTCITIFTATASVSNPFIDFATEILYNNKKVGSTIEITGILSMLLYVHSIICTRLLFLKLNSSAHFKIPATGILSSDSHNCTIARDS